MITFTGDEKDILKGLHPIGAIQGLQAIRMGIFTWKERWNLFDKAIEAIDTSLNIQIPINAIPTHAWLEQIKQEPFSGDRIPLQLLEYPWQLYQLNDQMIREDVQWLPENFPMHPLATHITVLGHHPIYVDPSAQIAPCYLNATEGPIFIGKNASIMEGAMIRGPFAACEGSVVKMGAKIYKGTTIGAHVTVGGELKNAIIMDFSNKSHEGYIGDSVIDIWCNIGAGTSNSNVKNNAAIVHVYHPKSKKNLAVGQKAGLIMGAFSRSAINTSFNTGTIVGVSSNVFGQGLTPKVIPDFAWGFSPLQSYELQKALIAIENWKNLKNYILTEGEIQLLRGIFDTSYF